MEDQDIPIDINSGKLLDWLISRRHCNKNWQANVLVVREKINNAIQDMPAHDKIIELLSGTYINYFHCVKIVEILKQTEADTKNIFGQYGSQRMRDWQEILRLYEKDNLYLAEAAQMLIRNINYEVPSFKKQIHKLEQTKLDLEKKENEYKKSENMAQSEFNTLCKQLGISGQKIKHELAEKVSELPEIYKKIADKSKSIQDVIQFYDAFVQFTLGRQHDGGCVPMAKYIVERGNTTTYEWIYREPPLAIVEPALNITFDLDDDDDKPIVDADANEIDFNGLDLKDEIDFGDDINLEAEGEIDWGDGGEAVANEIDYEINLEESGIVVEDAGHEGGTATDNEAYTVLDNPSTRGEFIDQLFELEAFLKLRLYEFKGDDSKNLLSFSQMQEALPCLQLATSESTQIMLDNVQVILSEMLDNKVQHLHNIKHSSRYVDVLAASLKQKLVLKGRMIASQKLMRQKRDEAEDQIRQLRPVLELIVQKTKELQKEIQQDISKRYKNRVVHLTGGITNLY